MVTLYGAPASVFVRKVRILLEEKNIQYISDPINLYEYVTEAFEHASPLHKIPAFRDGDFTLADSSAICAYLEKKYPQPEFYPQDPEQYGRALWFEEYADTVLFQAIAPCYYQTILVPLYKNKEPDALVIQKALSEQLPKVAAYLESQLIDKHFLVGSQFTIADVAVVSMFMNMHLSGFPLDHQSWPNLANYLDRHFERESFRACIKDVVAEQLRCRNNNRTVTVRERNIRSRVPLPDGHGSELLI